jgi:hypothetical protein
MIIRTSNEGQPSFRLEKNKLIENDAVPYFLERKILKRALTTKATHIVVWITGDLGKADSIYGIHQGKTQRGKKYIQIGCKRFVGENRRKLIAWAKA